MPDQQKKTVQDNSLSNNIDTKLVRPTDESLATQDLPPFQADQDILRLFTTLKKHLSAAPTDIPRNFWEQLQLVDDGSAQSIAAFINGAWKLFGQNTLQVATGGFGIIQNNNEISITTGFRPKLIIMIACIPDTDYFCIGYGYDSSHKHCITKKNTGFSYMGYLLAFFNGTDGRYATFNTISDTGLTLTITSDGSGLSPYYSYLVIG